MQTMDFESRDRWLPEKPGQFVLWCKLPLAYFARGTDGKKEIWVHARMKECGTAHGLCVSSHF
jgi:hypothetical protein